MIATPEEWEAVITTSEAFKSRWALDRKESGLRKPTSKWMCPVRAGRGFGCTAIPESIKVAQDNGWPINQAPDDWADRPCCVNQTVDFTPDPTDSTHQRKLVQRFYVGSKRWWLGRNRRSYVEGAFGILKNPARQSMRRGQNRLPGLTMATLIAGLKIALYNEEQLRKWHFRTGLGPADHPLLQPDPIYHGFKDLTEDEAAKIDTAYLRHLNGDDDSSAAAAVVIELPNAA
jgi:hypothetical protein